jgi:hypothetical protein
MVMFGESLLPMAQEAVGLAASVYSSLSQFWGRDGISEMGDVIDLSAANYIDLLRLQRQLTVEQAQSIFTDSGELNQEIIENSKLLTIGKRLRNPELLEELMTKGGDISDWGKYSTLSFPSPSDDFQMHFYRNPITNDAYYGMDYKAVFSHQESWDFAPTPHFNYEPPTDNP